MKLPAKMTLIVIVFWLLYACTPSLQLPDSTSVTTGSTATEYSDTVIPNTIVLPTTTPTQDPIATSRPYRLQKGELVLAASPGDIPAIFADDSLFISAQAGDEEWDDKELVVGVEINGDARAYPVRLLSVHEVVNDVVGGQPIVVTWCPLCFTAITFNRVLDRELTFGASGYLFKNNLVLYDHQSNTLWSQALGQGIKGAYSKDRLEILPSILTSWEKWKAIYPQTRVLSWVQMGKRADEVIDPYVGYYTSGAPGLGGQDKLDDRLATKSLVVGMQVAKITRAYPLDLIKEEQLINDVVDVLPIILVYNESFATVFVYDRRVDDRILTFVLDIQIGYFRDTETLSLWDEMTGIAIEGELAGFELTRLASHMVFWFAWSDIHQETEIYARRE